MSFENVKLAQLLSCRVIWTVIRCIVFANTCLSLKSQPFIWHEVPRAAAAEVILNQNLYKDNIWVSDDSGQI